MNADLLTAEIKMPTTEAEKYIVHGVFYSILPYKSVEDAKKEQA